MEDPQDRLENQQYDQAGHERAAAHPGTAIRVWCLEAAAVGVRPAPGDGNSNASICDGACPDGDGSKAEDPKQDGCRRDKPIVTGTGKISSSWKDAVLSNSEPECVVKQHARMTVI